MKYWPKKKYREMRIEMDIEKGLILIVRTANENLERKNL